MFDAVLQNIIANLIVNIGTRVIVLAFRAFRRLLPFAYSRVFGDEASQTFLDGLEDQPNAYRRLIWTIHQLASEVLALTVVLWKNPTFAWNLIALPSMAMLIPSFAEPIREAWSSSPIAGRLSQIWLPSLALFYIVWAGRSRCYRIFNKIVPGLVCCHHDDCWKNIARSRLIYLITVVGLYGAALIAVVTAAMESKSFALVLLAVAGVAGFIRYVQLMEARRMIDIAFNDSPACSSPSSNGVVRDP
jgi:hypothetical protein